MCADRPAPAGANVVVSVNREPGWRRSVLRAAGARGSTAATRWPAPTSLVADPRRALFDAETTKVSRHDAVPAVAKYWLKCRAVADSFTLVALGATTNGFGVLRPGAV